VLDQRGQLLQAALGFAGCSMPSYDRALWALRIWLDSWSGIGHIAVGMARQSYDLQLTRYDEKGWRVVASILKFLTCFVLGLLAGGMLVIGISRVSFGRASRRATFRHGSRPTPTGLVG
jgi:hypothetical protein